MCKHTCTNEPTLAFSLRSRKIQGLKTSPKSFNGETSLKCIKVSTKNIHIPPYSVKHSPHAVRQVICLSGISTGGGFSNAILTGRSNWRAASRHPKIVSMNSTEANYGALALVMTLSDPRTEGDSNGTLNSRMIKSYSAPGCGLGKCSFSRPTPTTTHIFTPLCQNDHRQQPCFPYRSSSYPEGLWLAHNPERR